MNIFLHLNSVLDHALMQFPYLEIAEIPRQRLERIQLIVGMRDYAKPHLFEIAWEVANRGIFY